VQLPLVASKLASKVLLVQLFHRVTIGDCLGIIPKSSKMTSCPFGLPPCLILVMPRSSRAEVSSCNFGSLKILSGLSKCPR